eukprot:6325869-Pyramimonas_sp.AAC.1
MQRLTTAHSSDAPTPVARRFQPIGYKLQTEHVQATGQLLSGRMSQHARSRSRDFARECSAP